MKTWKIRWLATGDVETKMTQRDVIEAARTNGCEWRDGDLYRGTARVAFVEPEWDF